MSDHELSRGDILRLMNIQEGDTGVYDSPHVVQVLSVKKIGAARDGAPDRYRLVISDGETYVQSMLTTQKNHLIEDGELKKHTVVRLEKLTCNPVQGRRVFIILNLSILAQAEDRIGEPVSLDVPGKSNEDGLSADNTPREQKLVQKTQQQTNGPSVYPIEGLSPYQNKWTIKACVKAKSDIRQWSNQKGEGKVFNVTFMDESGEIQATGFNHQVDQFYDKLEEGKVYYVSKARVNFAKKKFSSVQNEYELSLQKETEIVECEDQAGAPKIKYNFVPLSDLQEIQKDATCDVIGIVKEVSDVSTIVTRVNRETKKRELLLVDRSGYSVRMTLWGKQAEAYNAEANAIVAFKSARVGDFGGRSLSMTQSTYMAIDPDIPEAHVLRGWFDSLTTVPQFNAQSGAGAIGGGTGNFRREEMRTLLSVKDSTIGTSDKPDYFSCRATVVHIKSDNLYYPACPNDQCNKKVVETNEGWRCEKCDRSFSKPEYCYLMSMSVADYTAQTWLNGFNEVGLVVFGKTANELKELKERDESAYNAAVAKALCNTFNFNCRAKQETYNEAVRVRYGIVKIFPLDYKEEAGILRDMLKGEMAK